MKSTAFDEKLHDDAYPPGIEHSFWLQTRNRIIVRLLADVIPDREVEKSPVLDVGCGSGLTVSHLLRHGYDAYGVDLNDYCACLDDLQVKNRCYFGIQAEDLPLDIKNKIKIILSLDVLEHLFNPTDFLRETFGDFASATHAIITVPAFPELWSNYDLHYKHVCRYNPETLRNQISSAGGQLVEMSYLFKALYLPTKWWLKLFGDRPIKINSPKHLPVHSLLASYFEKEYRWTPAGWAGTSLLALVKINR